MSKEYAIEMFEKEIAKLIEINKGRPGIDIHKANMIKVAAYQRAVTVLKQIKL